MISLKYADVLNFLRKSTFTYLLNQSKIKYKLLKLMISHLIHPLILFTHPLTNLFLCLGRFSIIIIIIIIIKLK